MFWGRIVDSLKIMRQIDSVKLIIVDLDDTLWRVSQPKGQPRRGPRRLFQNKFLAASLRRGAALLKRRGGLLAIASKNDEEPTRKRFKQIWGEGLTLEISPPSKLIGNLNPKISLRFLRRQFVA